MKKAEKIYQTGKLVSHEGRTAVQVGDNKFLNFYGLGFNYEDAVKIANHFCKEVIDLTK